MTRSGTRADVAPRDRKKSGLNQLIQLRAYCLEDRLREVSSTQTRCRPVYFFRDNYARPAVSSASLPSGPQLVLLAAVRMRFLHSQAF
jgi:hypothetical protein